MLDVLVIQVSVGERGKFPGTNVTLNLTFYFQTYTLRRLSCA